MSRDAMRDRKEQAENYRNKSEEARALAETMKDKETKQFLIGVSRDYQMMAEVLDRTGLGDMLPASE